VHAVYESQRNTAPAIPATKVGPFPSFWASESARNIHSLTMLMAPWGQTLIFTLTRGVTKLLHHPAFYNRCEHPCHHARTPETSFGSFVPIPTHPG
jgi:hypothetical protein